MRKTIISLALVIFCTAFISHTSSASVNWDEETYRNIEKAVVEPQFKTDTVNIKDVGAVAFKKD